MKIINAPQLNRNQQISQTNKKNISFEAIRIKQISPDYAQIGSALERELEEFSKNPQNAQLLGAGVTSAVYKFNRFKNIVFKKSLNYNDNFQEEISHLKMLPSTLKQVQRFIAQAFDDETGLFYLISTKVSGKEADCKKNPWTKKHLRNFFNTLFELDKNGIYHGDLHCGNILIDNEGKANLIDFQWTHRIFRKNFFDKKPQSILPPFMLSENSQMFEMAGIPYYIKFMENSKQGKNFFIDYLKEKAIYHEKRSKFLRNLLKTTKNEYEKDNIVKGINYEDAQSIMFRNPDTDVIRVETKKLQFLSDFREAYDKVDISNPQNNYVTTTSSYLITLNAIQDMRHELAVQLKQKHLTNAKKDYLKYSEEYAKYWYDNVSSWVRGIYDSTINMAENTTFVRNRKVNYDNFENITDLYKFIGENYRSTYNETFTVSETIKDLMKLINKETSNMTREYIFLDFDPFIMKKINEIRKVNAKFQEAVKNNRNFDVLNYSILSIIKNRELYNILESKPNTETRNLIMYQLYNTKEMYKKISENTFRQIFGKIWFNKPEIGNLTGYNGMYNFQ